MQTYNLSTGSTRELEALKKDPLHNHHAARQRLAEQRRALINSLAASYQAEQSEAHINLIIRVQKAIEVIDKTIGEEQAVSQTG